MGTTVLTFAHESASLKLKQLVGSQWLLTNLWAKERQKGHGRKLMEIVTEYADNEGLTIALEVKWYGPVNQPHMTNQQLVAFYREFGFEKAVGKNNPTLMFRLPSQKIHGT